MSYGLSIYSEAGGLTLTTTDITWNQVDFFQVAAGGSASNNYPIVSGRSTLVVQMFINPPPLDSKAIAHSYSWSGTTLNVSGGNQATYFVVLFR